MNRTLHQIINRLSARPRMQFVVDGIGALASGTVCSLILLPHYTWTGLPEKGLSALALAAFCFFGYDVCSYALVRHRAAPFIWGIALFNFLYLLFSAALLKGQWQHANPWVKGYFLAEMLVLALLVYIECRVAAALKG